MNISVYISSEQIQMIGYEGKVAKRFVTHSLPEGAMYNGTIIDRAYMISSLKSIDNDNPGFLKGEVRLIVDGSSILSRKIATPKLNQKQLMSLVRDEFLDTIENPDQIVCGYRPIRTGENAVMGFAAAKEQMDSYVSVFSEAGIKLSAIRVGTESVINYVESRQEFHDSTIVLNIIDGMTMLSMVFFGGANVFISRTRLYGEGDQQMLDGILDNLGGLLQFTQSQNFGTIDTSFYIGLGVEDVGYLVTHNQYPDVNLTTLQVYDGPGGSPPPETHFCCLNMQMTAKCVDLLAVHKKMSGGGKGGKGLNKKFLMIIPALIILGLVAMSVNLYLESTALDREIERINALINSPDTQARQIEIALMRDEVALLSEVAEQRELKNEWENTRVKATRQLLDSILFRHTMVVRVSSFTYNESASTVSVSAVCADATVSADYVDYLYDSGIATRVTYTGYSTSGDGFSFSINIDLSLDFSYEDLLENLESILQTISEKERVTNPFGLDMPEGMFEMTPDENDEEVD